MIIFLILKFIIKNRKEPLSKTLPFKLRELREQRRFSQSELAEALDISQATYNNIESRKTSIDIKTLESVAHFYQLSISEILGENNASYFIQQNENGAQPHNNATNITIEESIHTNKLIKNLEENNNELRMRVEKRDKRIAELKSIIEKLRK